MKKIQFVSVAVFVLGFGWLSASPEMRAQAAKPPVNGDSEAKGGPAYSGMYSFLKDGEFVQVTVEEGGMSRDLCRDSATARATRARSLINFSKAARSRETG